MLIFITVYASIMLILYVRTTLMPSSKTKLLQNDLLDTMEKNVSEELSEKIMISILMTSTIIITIFYSAFYLISAIMVGQTFYTIISALFVVISVRSAVKFYEVIKNKTRSDKVPSKIGSYVGLVYMGYFFRFLYDNYYNEHQTSLVIGTVIGLILGLAYIRKSKKNKNVNKKHL